MSYSLYQQQLPKQQQKLTQRLMMSPQMQQAIDLLQAPVFELSQKVEREMESNPVLEYIDPEEEIESSEEKAEKVEEEIDFEEHQLDILKQLDDEFRDHFAESEGYNPRRSSEEEKLKSFLESSIEDQPTLFEHLIQQAKEEGFNEKEMQIAEVICGQIDRQGYLKNSPEEIAFDFHFERDEVEKVLKKVQSFDPPGVAARDLREVLLAQLMQKGSQASLAYAIIESHFDDLLHNRLPQIQKALNEPMEKIRHAVHEEIACLNLHPCSVFDDRKAPPLIPDASLELENGALTVRVHDGDLQPLRINRKYLRMLDDPNVAEETKQFIKTKILSARWLLKNLDQRGDTLYKIAEAIAKRQRSFFMTPDGKLHPMTMKMLAEELSLHESTIARAVSNKVLDTPRGIFQMRFFFSNAFVDSQGRDLSSKTVKQMVQQLIDEEDKAHPLSDEEISKALTKRGIECARRTVAKYRQELKVGNTQQRRKY